VVTITGARRLTLGVLILLSIVPLSANAADGVESVNSYVEEKHSATDFRARSQSVNGQRSTSGFDFIVSLESEDVSDAGTLTLEYKDLPVTQALLSIFDARGLK